MTTTSNHVKALLARKRETLWAKEIHKGRTKTEQLQLYAAHETIQAAESLVDQAEHIRDRMDRLIARIENNLKKGGREIGCGINSLGELQNAGGDLDRLCAELVLQEKFSASLKKATD